MIIDNQDFTIYYSNEYPYVEYEIKELSEYNNKININFIKIDSSKKLKMHLVFLIIRLICVKVNLFLILF